MVRNIETKCEIFAYKDTYLYVVI